MRTAQPSASSLFLCRAIESAREVEYLFEIALALQRQNAQAEQLDRQHQGQDADEERMRRSCVRGADRGGRALEEARVLSQRLEVPLKVNQHPAVDVEREQQQAAGPER